ncbi:hypothetical protein ACI798_10310 [Geodermatophilus sp. SYSU D01045]
MTASLRDEHPAVRPARRRLRGWCAALALAALATVLVVVPGHPADAAWVPANATQLVTVEVPTATSTTGSLRAWERTASGWRLVFGPVPARVGAAGVGQAREGISVTPAGTYPLTGGFGRQPNPGTALPYFQTDELDWWDGNPSSPTYNTHVRQAASPGGASENLYRTGAVYDYAVTIGYNLARVPGAGSAIFLHVANSSATGGCVSIERNALVTLMRWLRPDAAPHIMVNVAPVKNAVADSWYAAGGQASLLGLPTGAERAVGDGRGATQDFEGGTVAWSGATGAHWVVNGIARSWWATGRERGRLGYPVTDEVATVDRSGAFTWFQDGAVYWSAPSGTHWMTGGILDAWVRQGYEQGRLGYPVTDELATADGRGAFSWFQRGAAYWSASSGTHWMTGGILDAWVRQGYEQGPLGYPVTDELATADGRGAFSWFQNGAAYWSASSGTHWMTGPVLDAWIRQGYEQGPLGYPVSDPYAYAGGTRVDFQGGSLVADRSGAVTRV